MERYHLRRLNLEFLPPKIRHHRNPKTHPQLRPQNSIRLLGPGYLVASLYPSDIHLVVRAVQTSGVWLE